MLDDDTKDAIRHSPELLWTEFDSDTRWQYMDEISNVEHRRWDLEANTVAVALFYSPDTGEHWYEWTAEQFTSALAQDSKNRR